MDWEAVAKAAVVLLTIGVAVKTGWVAEVFNDFPVIQNYVYFYARVILATVAGVLVALWLYNTSTGTSRR
jgi:surface polysaccharide O-acyltransferase-like enzyme